MKRYWYLLFFFIGNQQCIAQGGSTPASSMSAPVNLPFYDNSASTSGKGNHVNFPAGFANSYTLGPDYFYVVCPTVSSNITTTITYSSTNSGVHPSISVWLGIPGSGGSLISSATSPGDKSVDPILNTESSVIAGNCYYVMVDNWPSPNGYNYGISIYETPINTSCNNIGFENGNFSGWTGTTGIINKGAATNQAPYYKPTGFSVNTNQHTIFGGGNDAVCGSLLPCTYPGLGNSTMIGDKQGTGSRGATLEQRFEVTEDNAAFSYYYAVVFESAHDANESAMFKVDVVDCDGNEISCGKYQVVALPSAPGFHKKSGDTYYKTWTPVFLDLSPYINSCVAIRFTMGDCSQGAHYGYAYVDAKCNKLAIISGDTSICKGESTILMAPDGAAKYQWSKVGDQNVISNSQLLNVSPTQSTSYICTMTSYQNCPSSFKVNVQVDSVPELMNPGSITNCGDWNLPQIQGTNLSGNQAYYTNTQALGGTMTSGFISSSKTVWIYDQLGECRSEIKFPVIIITSPILTETSPIISCDSYNLPPITGLNLSGNEQYYNNSQALGGTPLMGVLTTSQEVWIYDSKSFCTDEKHFSLTINKTPLIDPQNAQIACETNTLLSITGLNLSGNQAYYDNSQSNGGLPINDEITSTQTVWIYDHQGLCLNETSFLVTIEKSPTFTSEAKIIACDSLELTTIVGTNLSGNEAYYTDSQSNGGLPISGTITSDKVLWIYDHNGICEQERILEIEINHTPILSEIASLEYCDSMLFQPIQGTNLSGNQQYYDDSQINGGIAISFPIYGSQTIWVYDEDGACKDETNFNVRIHNSPQFDKLGPVVACDQFELPIITGQYLSGNQHYYDNSQALQGAILLGTLTESQTIWIVDNQAICTVEDSFSLTIDSTPQLINPGDQTVCDSFELPGIDGQFLSGNQAYFSNVQQVNGQKLLSVLNSTQEVWIYDHNGNCADEISFLLTVHPTPLLSFSPDKIEHCVPLTVEFEQESTPNGDYFRWDFGDGETIVVDSTTDVVEHLYSTAGCFSITLQSSNAGCENSLTKENLICVHENATAQFTVDNTNPSLLMPTVQCVNTSYSASIFDWIITDGTNYKIKDITHTFAAYKGSYEIILIADNEYQCPDTTSIRIQLGDTLLIYFPNSFTPNKDNSNEQFVPVFHSGVNTSQYEMKIYDRWGAVVFETHNPLIGWGGRYGENGNDCQEGAYIWKVVFRDTLNNELHTSKGHVSLLR